MSRTKLGSLALTAAFAAACLATSAHAVETKCYRGDAELAQLKSELAAENQQPFLVGGGTAQGLPKNFFFSDPEGRVGYAAESNARIGTDQKPTVMCVWTKYRDVKMNNAELPGVPSWALIGSDTQKAKAAAVARNAGSWSVHDDSIKRASSLGSRVAFAAMTRVPTANGGERDGKLLLIDFDPKDRIGGVTVTGGDGVREGIRDLVQTAYTEQGAAFLAKRTQQASLELASTSPR